MADFQSSSEVFLNWFRSEAGGSFHSSLAITDLRSRNAGRGIIATAPIPADTELFTIPRRSIISVENSSLSKKLPQIFTTLKDAAAEDNAHDEDEISLPDPWFDLILVMIYEYLQGTCSPWKPYFEVLPSTFNTLMFWSEAELSELQASAVKDKIGRESAEEMFATKILPTIKQHSDVFYPANTPHLSDQDLITLSHRMGSMIMAYAFDLETENKPTDPNASDDGWEEDHEGLLSMGMVPMADMLNADAEFNAHLDHGAETLTMSSLRPIAAGEEVLNYYGALPNSDLLRRYGYTSVQHARHDVVEVSWDLIHAVIAKRFVGQALGAPDEEEMEDSFVLELESGEPDETGVNTSSAQFTGFPEELQVQVYQTIAPALGIDTGKKTGKEERNRLDRALFEVMIAVLQERLTMYATTVQQDEELLRRQDVQGRLRMAVDIRIGEKRLLTEALGFAQNYVKGLDQAPVQQEDGERPAKKQRR